LCQRARLVHAQDSGGAEHLDRRHAGGEHPVTRYAPCSQRKKDGQYYWKLLWRIPIASVIPARTPSSRSPRVNQ
jgi:hypothetical protein